MHLGTDTGIGLFCACVPREPILAAGFRPVPITGDECSPSGTALPGNLCAHVRRTASWLSGPGGRALAGVVIIDGCYPMLRLRDFLRSRPGLPESWLLRLPRRHSPEAVRFLREELLGLTRVLSTLPGGQLVSDRHLGEATATEARRRERNLKVAERIRNPELEGLTPELLAALDGSKPGDSPPAGGSKTASPPDRRAGTTRKPGVLVRGSFSVNADFVRLIRELGGEIRGLESCVHDRPGTPPFVPVPGQDPFEGLADWMLRRPPCPRGEIADGCLGASERLSPAPGIDGVIFLRMKHCAAQGYDLPVLRTTLRNTGVPLLVLEIEEADWRQQQLVTRIEAFLESLGERTLVSR